MKRSRAYGFTYIECLFVLAIVGVLAAIALPRFFQAQTHARQSEAITNLKSLHAAMGTQQSKPYLIRVYNFDPPRGNRYSYHLNNACTSTEDRSTLNAIQNDWDDCIGVDQFNHWSFPSTFSVVPVVNPIWDDQATSNGMGASAGTFGACEYPLYWDYLAYAAGDVDFEGPDDYEHIMDGADTWLVSSADGHLNRVCPATSSPLFAPAGEPFMVYDDEACN